MMASKDYSLQLKNLFRLSEKCLQSKFEERYVEKFGKPWSPYGRRPTVSLDPQQESMYYRGPSAWDISLLCKMTLAVSARQENEAIKEIRSVRNDFSHSPHSHFGEEQEWIERLQRALNLLGVSVNDIDFEGAEEDSNSSLGFWGALAVGGVALLAGAAYLAADDKQEKKNNPKNGQSRSYY